MKGRAEAVYLNKYVKKIHIVLKYFKETKIILVL